MALMALLFGGFCWMYWDSYSWDRDQWNQERIAKAYVSFYADKTNYPNNLADLVKAGYLPEKAEWYKEPPGLLAHPADFKDSSYVVLPPESGNVENMKMIGSKAQQNGKDIIDFTSPQNSVVRDAIEQLQRKHLK
jgi:hypothetical protein